MVGMSARWHVSSLRAVDDLDLRGDHPTTTVDREPEPDVLRWPLDAAERPALRAARRPCLWLLELGELPPELDELEDWVRLPATPEAIHARTERLVARTLDAGRLRPGEVRVDADGIVAFGAGAAVVPPIEALILNRLGGSPDRVVRRAELVELLWSDAPRCQRAIDSRIHTLRARVEPLGLHIHTIRGQGFVLSRRPRPSTGAAQPDAARSTAPWSS